MKRNCTILVFVFACVEMFSQANYDAFVGTWVYQKNDTIFKIRLQKGTMKTSIGVYNNAFGGYYLSIKGVVKEDFIKIIPPSWDANIPAPSCNIYIRGFSNTPNYLGFTFYDQRMQQSTVQEYLAEQWT